MPIENWWIEDCTGCPINFDLIKASWVGNADEGIYYMVYADCRYNCFRYLAAAGDETRRDGLQEVLALTNYEFKTFEDAVKAVRKLCKLWCVRHDIEITDVYPGHWNDQQGPSRDKVRQVAACHPTKAEVEQLREENERLRELVEASKGDRKAIDELVDENLRLRELLRDCQPYVENHLVCDTRLCDAVEKEVGMLSCSQSSSCCVKKEKEVGDE